jgi:hypothetical protein
MKKTSALKAAALCGLFAISSMSVAETGKKTTKPTTGTTTTKEAPAVEPTKKDTWSSMGSSATESKPVTESKNTSSFWSKWSKGEEWKPYVQLGGRATHAAAGAYKMPSVIETEVQAGVWYENYVGVYVFGASGLIRNDSTTYGAGVKVPFYSTDLGADTSSFFSGMSLFAAADYAKHSGPRPSSAAADYDKDPSLLRWGVGTNIGVGPWGTYVDASLMLFSHQGQLHWAPVGAIGYVF